MRSVLVSIALVSALNLAIGGRSLAQEDPPMSEEYLRKWTIDPSEADPRWEEAAKLRYRGDVDAALELYHAFLDESPNEVSVVISVGTAHWEKGRLEEAERWLRKAIEMVPKHVKARQFLGQLLFQRGLFSTAKAELEELLALEWCPEDVRASARLNLAKIALIERRINDADKLFFAVGKSPEKGDRASAETGRMLGARMRRTLLWPRESTAHLDITFSPEAAQAKDVAARKQWAAAEEAACKKMGDMLGMRLPERIPIYVFSNEVDAYAVSGQEDLHSWKYSWWFTWTSFDRPTGHAVAHQLAARVRGSRPASKVLVEGLCCWIDADPADPHAEARKLLQAGKLPTIVKMHADQGYGLDQARPVSESFVAHLISTYGLERFLTSYGSYNNVLLDPEWKVAGTGQVRWSDALSEVLRRGIGKDLQQLESEWHAILRR